MVSADGCVVAFESSATDLQPGAPAPVTSLLQIFLYDCKTGGVSLATLRGKCEVPMTAEAVAVNLTVLSPTAPGFLTVFAAGQIPPPSSNTNFARGVTRANNAVLTPGVSGKVSVSAGMASGQLDVLIDVVGYFE